MNIICIALIGHFINALTNIHSNIQKTSRLIHCSLIIFKKTLRTFENVDFFRKLLVKVILNLVYFPCSNYKRATRDKKRIKKGLIERLFMDFGR